MNNFSMNFMLLALNEAKNAYAANEVPVGAIISKGGKIIGRGFNQVIKIILSLLTQKSMLLMRRVRI